MTVSVDAVEPDYVWQPLPRRRSVPLTTRALAVAVLVVLAFDFPTNWFRVSPRDAGVSDASAVGPLAGFFLLGAVCFALLQLAKSLDSVLTGLRAEPLIPTMLTLGLISTLWSSRPAATIETVASLLFVLVLSYWLMAVFSFRQIMLLVGVALAIGTLAHLAFIFGLPRFGTNRQGGWDGVLIHENALGRSSALAILQFGVLSLAHRPGRYIWLGFSMLSVWLLLGSTSKTGLATAVLLPALALVFVAFRSRRTLFGASLLAIGGAAVGALLVATANLDFLVGDLLDKDVTLTGRTELWTATIAEAQAQPLLGYGWDGFWGGWFSASHPILASRDWSPPHSHNALLEYFLALGVVGIAFGLAIFARLLWRGIHFIRRHPGALGLWPLTFACYALLFSITEVGVITRDVPFLLLIVASVVVRTSTEIIEDPGMPVLSH